MWTEIRISPYLRAEWIILCKAMNENTKKALNVLNEGNYTLVIFDGQTVKTDNRRGIKPLLELAENNVSLKGNYAADKVVGKAAAYLYVILEVSEVYASVISKPALEVLNNYGVRCEYNTLTDFIKNRDNTGFCPMETAVMYAVSPNDALNKIKRALTLISAH